MIQLKAASLLMELICANMILIQFVVRWVSCSRILWNTIYVLMKTSELVKSLKCNNTWIRLAMVMQFQIQFEVLRTNHLLLHFCRDFLAASVRCLDVDLMAVWIYRAVNGK